MIFDSALLDQGTTREMTPEGYLLAKVALTKVGVQDYSLSDLTGNPADEGKVVGVFRPKETVFHQETKDSAKMKPFTELHPDQFVDINNYKNLSLGHIGDKIEALDSERLGASLLVTDKSLIDKIQNGLNEISVGYTANIVEKKGIYKGQKYDYAFDGPMYINHIAVVPAGRCGDSVSILDKKGDKTMSESSTQTQKKTDVKTSSLEDLAGMVKDLSESIKDMQDKFKTFQQAREEFASKGEQKDAKTEKKIADEATIRAQVVDKVKSLVKEIGDKSAHDLLVEACGDMVTDAKEKSNDYLMAIVDQKLKSKEQAKSQFNDVANSKPENQAETAHLYDAKDLFKIKKQAEVN